MIMMRKLLVGAALAAGLALAGCQTAADLATDISTVAQSVNQKAKAAQAEAVKICDFVPALASVVSIFNSGFSSNVSTVGHAICDAVTTLPLADGPGDRRPRVNGVLIKGEFVKKR